MLLFVFQFPLMLHVFLRLLFFHLDHSSRLRIDLNLHPLVLRRDDLDFSHECVGFLLQFGLNNLTQHFSEAVLIAWSIVTLALAAISTVSFDLSLFLLPFSSLHAPFMAIGCRMILIAKTP